MIKFKYILKRFLYALITVWVLVTVTFFLMHILPGDPFLGEKKVPDEIRQALYVKYGLDKPLIVQYGNYLWNILRGDLGDSIVYVGQPVTRIIAETFPYSFDLGLRALAFAFIFGVSMGIIAALKRGRPTDKIIMIFAALGISVPSFILGSLLQYYLSIKLSGWTNGVFGFRLFPVSGWETLSQKIIPPFVLGFGQLALISRLMRASTLEVVGQNYIKTARSKGLSERTVIMRHTIRNAILPVVTVMGPLSAAILTGAFVVENIFNIPGMGQYFVSSVQAYDYPMIVGTTLFYGVFLVAANLLVDILYTFIDPTINIAGRQTD